MDLTTLIAEGRAHFAAGGNAAQRVRELNQSPDSETLGNIPAYDLQAGSYVSSAQPWIKVFCCLTDVGEENGPHAFVAGSHKTIQQIVTHDGRYSDEEAFAHFPRSSEVRLTGPAGTVFLEDTLGFHKGVPVREGRRGVFEFEYSINHYGYPHEGTWFSGSLAAIAALFSTSGTVLT